MALTITISAVTGSTPYQVYVCQGDGTGCLYIAQTSTIPYTFEIPPPIDTSTSYMVKIIDAAGCIITSTQTST